MPDRPAPTMRTSRCSDCMGLPVGRRVPGRLRERSFGELWSASSRFASRSMPSSRAAAAPPTRSRALSRGRFTLRLRSVAISL